MRLMPLHSYRRRIDARKGADMGTVSVEQVRARRPIGVSSVVAYVGAAGFAVAGLWGYLIEKGVTVRAEPTPVAGATLHQRLAADYGWFVSILNQERFSTTIAIAAFLCLAVVALLLGRRLAARPVASVGCAAVGIGAVLWVAGAVLQLGGHRAVGLMATHENPIGAVNAIAFTIDMIEQAFSLAAFALIGMGMVAVALSALRGRSEPVGWIICTEAVALLTLTLAVSYLVDPGSLRDLLVLGAGLAGAPIWLVWTGTMLRSDAGSSRAS
jgi:hypothetical protein